MLITSRRDSPSSEITPQGLYLRRREFLQAASGAALAAAAALAPPAVRRAAAQTGAKLPNVQKSPLSTSEPLNDYEDVTTYNHFYEFGGGKADPSQARKTLRTKPWNVIVPAP